VPEAEKSCNECGHPPHCGCGCGCCVRDHSIAPDPIIEGIDPDCCGGAGLTMLRGVVAPGGADGLWRLYRTWELDEYVLLRDEDIVAQRKQGDTSMIWICGDQPVLWVRVRSASRLQQEFLDGRIARAVGAPRPPSVVENPVDDVWDGPSSNRSKCYC
jgi:hypothetical protein